MTILYIGTAEGLAIYSEAGGGLERLGLTLAGRAVPAIAAPLADTLVAAVAGAAPQQSFDGGQSWSAAGGPAPEPAGLRAVGVAGPEALANPRLMGATAYARLGGKGGALLGAGAGGTQLFRSLDDGIHWEPAAGPMVGRILALAPHPRRAATAFAGAESGALLRSDDRGASWREVAREPAAVLCIVAAPRG